uniref:Protein-serine/threonine phosphatase n=1 Tax=Rhizochromulina marina TaxID=1034831 RepID=A0A7S2RB86_9STRA|mmetsp:Transcript_13691/g.39967  ORF Transcript_13691/g.39967 Transcript_13691/m.39967 type:complete len:1510 (+) Transcript_13691:58-4587(+)
MGGGASSNRFKRDAEVALHVKKASKHFDEARVGDFVLTEVELGRGAFSIVKLGIYRPSEGKAWDARGEREVAIKCVDMKKLRQRDMDSLADEVQILKQMRHPSIIEVEAVLNDGNFFYIVMEKLEGGELFDRIVKKESYTEREAQNTTLILLNAVGYMHSRNIVHRDLKPENLLLKSNENDTDIKIADFGSAIFLPNANREALEALEDGDSPSGAAAAAAATAAAVDEEEDGEGKGLGPAGTGGSKTQRKKANHALGTPYFMAPELFECNDGSNAALAPSIDIWSLGATLYMLVCGRPPWMGRNELELSHQIQHIELSFPNAQRLDPHVRHLLNKVLVKEHSRRLTLEQIARHDWVTREGSDPLEWNDEDFRGAVTKRDIKAATRRGSVSIAGNDLEGTKPRKKRSTPTISQLASLGLPARSPRSRSPRSRSPLAPQGSGSFAAVQSAGLSGVDLLAGKAQGAKSGGDASAEQPKLASTWSSPDMLRERGIIATQSEGCMVPGDSEVRGPTLFLDELELDDEHEEVGFNPAGGEPAQEDEASSPGSRGKTQYPSQRGQYRPRSNTTGDVRGSVSKRQGKGPRGSTQQRNPRAPRSPRSSIQRQELQQGAKNMEVTHEFKDLAVRLRKGKLADDEAFTRGEQRYMEMTLTPASSKLRGFPPDAEAAEGAQHGADDSPLPSELKSTGSHATLSATSSEASMAPPGGQQPGLITSASSSRSITKAESSGGDEGDGGSESRKGLRKITQTFKFVPAAVEVVDGDAASGKQLARRGLLRLGERENISSVPKISREAAMNLSMQSIRSSAVSTAEGSSGLRKSRSPSNAPSPMVLGAITVDGDDSENDEDGAFDVGGQSADRPGAAGGSATASDMFGSEDDSDDGSDYSDLDDGTNIESVNEFLEEAITLDKKRRQPKTDEDLSKGEEKFRPLPRDQDPWFRRRRPEQIKASPRRRTPPVVHVNVQVRNWGQQRNLAATRIRYGFTSNQGPCAYMEDRVSALPLFSDIAPPAAGSGGAAVTSPRASAARSKPSTPTASKAAAVAAAAAAAVLPAGDHCILSASSFFGVFDGHRGAEVAEQLQKELQVKVHEKLQGVRVSDIQSGRIDEGLKAAFLEVEAAVVQREHQRITEERKQQHLTASRSAGATAVCCVLFRARLPPLGTPMDGPTPRTSTLLASPSPSRSSSPRRFSCSSAASPRDSILSLRDSAIRESEAETEDSEAASPPSSSAPSPGPTPRQSSPGLRARPSPGAAPGRARGSLKSGSGSASPQGAAASSHRNSQRATPGRAANAAGAASSGGSAKRTSTNSRRSKSPAEVRSPRSPRSPRSGGRASGWSDVGLAEGSGPVKERVYLVAANVGDSRAVISRAGKAVALTTDHKVEAPQERERILAAGGNITDGRLEGILAVSRAFGDIALKSKQLTTGQLSNDPTEKSALTAEPEVTHTLVTVNDEFLVIATDGLWDVLSNQQVVNFVRRRLKTHNCAQRAANDLVQEALDQGSHDNTSAVVCMLNQN